MANNQPKNIQGENGFCGGVDRVRVRDRLAEDGEEEKSPGVTPVYAAGHFQCREERVTTEDRRKCSDHWDRGHCWGLVDRDFEGWDSARGVGGRPRGWSQLRLPSELC